MKMHPVGSLILQLMDGEFDEIALQLNENVSDDTEMKINLDLLRVIQDQFQKNGEISLALINKYLGSLNFKMKTSIQRYIKDNHLEEFGIDIIVSTDEVHLKIDKRKVKQSIKTENHLRKAYPGVMKEVVSELDAELQAERADVVIETAEAFEEELPPPPPEF
jgi:galactitol-specific phosphotransferase system IIB component